MTAAQWAVFDALRAQHAAKLMIWEEELPPEVRAELKKRGVRPVVFRTCGNRPPKGDYLQVMQQNLDALRAAFN